MSDCWCVMPLLFIAPLARSGEEVMVALSRETAELVSRLVDARARGEEILVSPGNAEVTPTEAAALLGMSRPQVGNRSWPRSSSTSSVTWRASIERLANGWYAR